MDITRLPYQRLNGTRPIGWKVDRNAPKKTWSNQVAQDLKRLHFTVAEAQKAALNRDQWCGITRDVLNILALASTTHRSFPL
ncbi:hypothetical protein FKM82_025666 [Ascaphus truei]